MKYLKESAIIFGITLAGEALYQFLPIPVPPGVYGLFLLLALLCLKVIKLPDVEAAGNFLLEIMPVLFIPASVGVLESFEQIRSLLAPLLVVCTVSTVIVMAVTGKVAERLVGGQSRDRETEKAGKET